MSIRNQRESLHADFKHSDKSSRWPYDSKYSLTAREGEFLPPWLQEEAQYRPLLSQRTEEEKSKHLPATVPSDLQLKAQILEYLIYMSPTGGDQIEVKVKDAEVIFEGSVRDHWMKLQIEGLAEQIPGIKKIINNIQVNPMPEAH